eukprot:Seg1088.4 transcript_id=Seg1088.4/GoldUCD/mRNA.D3Y31 product="hypothetical protein" protein_id=Seg1088.4/GoldUCD/D3Y31
MYTLMVEASEEDLQSARRALEEKTPPPMNDMLERQSRDEAIAKKLSRKSMAVVDVPPTSQGSEINTHQGGQQGKTKRKRPTCKRCNVLLKGHKCPFNK